LLGVELLKMSKRAKIIDQGESETPKVIYAQVVDSDELNEEDSQAGS
jgi:hypothetical protein